MKTKKYAISFAFPKFQTYYLIDSTNAKNAGEAATEKMRDELKYWYLNITHNKRAKVTKKILIVRDSWNSDWKKEKRAWQRKQRIK